MAKVWECFGCLVQLKSWQVGVGGTQCLCSHMKNDNFNKARETDLETISQDSGNGNTFYKKLLNLLNILCIQLVSNFMCITLPLWCLKYVLSLQLYLTYCLPIYFIAPSLMLGGQWCVRYLWVEGVEWSCSVMHPAALCASLQSPIFHVLWLPHSSLNFSSVLISLLTLITHPRHDLSRSKSNP